MFSKEEAKQLKLEFWETFESHCKKDPALRGKKPLWLLNNSGIKNINLLFEVDRNHASVNIEISHKNESRRFEIYEWVHSYKVIIEEGLEDELIWDYVYTRENGKDVCRIYTQIDNVDIYQKKDWPTIFFFLKEKMIILENNFIEIRDFLKKNM